MDNENCHAEHEEIKLCLHNMERTLEYHTGEVHASLLPKEQILTREEAQAADRHLQKTLDDLATSSQSDRGEIHRQLDEMAEIVLGTPHRNIDGMVTRSGGMAAMVKDNDNGGLRFKYANLIIGALLTVIVAVIGLAGTVVSHSDNTEKVVEQVIEQVRQEIEQLEQP